MADGDLNTGVNLRVLGDTYVNGDVSVAGSGHLYGDLTYSGTLNSPVPTVDGTIATGTTTITPTPYDPVTDLPAATAVIAGATDITASTVSSLTPTAYGDLSLTSTFSELRLETGRYDFQSFTLGASPKVYLDLTAPGILQVFCEGDMLIGKTDQFYVTLDGGATWHDLAWALVNSPNLASRIYWETHGTWKLGGDSDWMGTVYRFPGPQRPVVFQQELDLVRHPVATTSSSPRTTPPSTTYPAFPAFRRLCPSR